MLKIEERMKRKITYDEIKNVDCVICYFHSSEKEDESEYLTKCPYCGREVYTTALYDFKKPYFSQ